MTLSQSSEKSQPDVQIGVGFAVKYKTGSQRGNKPREHQPPKGSHTVNLSIKIIDGPKFSSPECTNEKTTITCPDIKDFILPMLNDIYNGTGIFFKIKQCSKLKTKAKDVYLEEKNSEPDYSTIESLFSERKLYDPSCINIYLVPIIGAKTNAYHFQGRNPFIVMAESKPDHCTKWDRTNFTSILAHEIGHRLGTSHSDNPNELMYPFAPMGTKIPPTQASIMLKKAKSVYPSRKKSQKISVGDTSTGSRMAI